MKCNDGARNPTWYVASSCALSGGGCSGDLYRVSGGSALASSWSGSVAVSKVGTIAIVFADNNDATATFSIDGAFGTKNMTRQVFGQQPAVQNDNLTKTQLLLGGMCSDVAGGYVRSSRLWVSWTRAECRSEPRARRARCGEIPRCGGKRGSRSGRALLAVARGITLRRVEKNGAARRRFSYAGTFDSVIAAAMRSTAFLMFSIEVANEMRR